MEIRAPLSGVTVPLGQVPDAVFAGKLAGEGVGLDPTSSEVLAPFDGKVTQLHRAHHALAITSAEGVEVLIHVGLDTVKLEGRHFTALVELGAQVTQGQPLLRFEADAVAREARSLISVVLVTNHAVELVAPALVEAGQTVLLKVAELPKLSPSPPAGERVGVRGDPILLRYPQGLHARPAAVLAQKAKQFVATIHLRKGEASANAKSVVALMGLSTRKGDEVVLEASGPDADAAIAALTPLLRGGEVSEPRLPSPRPSPPRGERGAGVPAAPGLALGRVVQLRGAVRTLTEHGGPPAEEKEHLRTAQREAALQLEALERQSNDPTRAAILRVQRELLEDPELLDRTHQALSEGKSAAFAWQQAYSAHAATLEKLDQPLLRERAVDLRDVGDRLLRLLVGEAPAKTDLPEDAIVIAEVVTPTQLVAFPAARLKGLVTTTGSSTSHVAILARGLGVPAVCGAEVSVLELPDGLQVVLDGTKGLLSRAPAADDVPGRLRLEAEIARYHSEHAAERAAAFGLGQTRDGHRVQVVANIRNLKDAREAIDAGAEGVGLLRSEYLFLERDQAPSEAEQAEVYKAVAQVVGKARPLVIRTLDVGGDKPLAYLPLPKEANPFLGVRGIRVSLDQPELFRAQLRAILQAADFTDLHVMFPMVSGLEEVREARKFLAQELAGGEPVRVGIMVEVPSAVAMAEELAREVDFFSIGTNDLTQYTLAMDRGHPLLASRADGLHPAVLRAIAATVAGARVHQRPVHLCGGMASDPLAVPLLVGLGITELSVSIPAVGAVKAALSRWSFAECEAIAAEALRLGTTAEVRALLTSRQPGEDSSRRLRSVATRAAGG